MIFKILLVSIKLLLLLIILKFLKYDKFKWNTVQKKKFRFSQQYYYIFCCALTSFTCNGSSRPGRQIILIAKKWKNIKLLQICTNYTTTQQQSSSSRRCTQLKKIYKTVGNLHFILKNFISLHLQPNYYYPHHHFLQVYATRH